MYELTSTPSSIIKPMFKLIPRSYTRPRNLQENNRPDHNITTDKVEDTVIPIQKLLLISVY